MPGHLAQVDVAPSVVHAVPEHHPSPQLMMLSPVRGQIRLVPPENGLSPVSPSLRTPQSTPRQPGLQWHSPSSQRLRLQSMSVVQAAAAVAAVAVASAAAAATATTTN